MTEEELEGIGEAEVRQSLARGDYHDASERSHVESWLRGKDEARAFDKACEMATKRFALDEKRRATRALTIAIFAAIMAAIANVLAVISVLLS